jgi:hypothetical protein
MSCQLNCRCLQGTSHTVIRRTRAYVLILPSVALSVELPLPSNTSHTVIRHTRSRVLILPSDTLSVELPLPSRHVSYCDQTHKSSCTDTIFRYIVSWTATAFKARLKLWSDALELVCWHSLQIQCPWTANSSRACTGTMNRRSDHDTAAVYSMCSDTPFIYCTLNCHYRQSGINTIFKGTALPHYLFSQSIYCHFSDAKFVELPLTTEHVLTLSSYRAFWTATILRACNDNQIMHSMLNCGLLRIMLNCHWLQSMYWHCSHADHVELPLNTEHVLTLLSCRSCWTVIDYRAWNDNIFLQ